MFKITITDDAGNVVGEMTFGEKHAFYREGVVENAIGGVMTGSADERLWQRVARAATARDGAEELTDRLNRDIRSGSTADLTDDEMAAMRAGRTPPEHDYDG